MNELTIGYITSRQEPRIKWFLESLEWLLPSDIGVPVTLVIVDLHAATRTDKHVPESLMRRLKRCLWIEPKPSVWHGRHRLTAFDFFSASNFRNTVIALAPDGHVAIVDDLSVLTPTWFTPVQEAIQGDNIICGSFQKVRKLKVEAGNVISFEPYDLGLDSRWVRGQNENDVGCPPEWMFGCSFCAPVEALLKINGYPEDLCDGMGYEDCVTGVAIALNGYAFKYSRRMKTLESAEDHHNQGAMLRYDPGKSPEDKSHALLEKVKGWRAFPQHFGKNFETLRELRSHMLSGGKFPIRHEPTHEWFTGMPINEFHNYNSGTNVIKTQK
jgi:hypothetical protein